MGVRAKLLGAAMSAMMAVGSAGASWAEPLTDALILAYRNSDLLEQNRALLRAADEDVAQAVASLRPVLAFIADAGYTDNGITAADFSASVALQASLDLYDGGANRIAIDSAKESVLSTRASLISVEQQVLLSAVEAYMAVRSASETVALGQNNVRLITEQLRAAKDRFEVGDVTRTDVSLAESRLATAQSNLVAGQGALAAAREAVAQAGLTEAHFGENCGVSIGSGFGGAQTLDRNYLKFGAEGSMRLDPMAVPKIMNNAAASHL